MPIFARCSGFQIHDGNFYEVSGDVNLRPHQPELISGDNYEAHLGAAQTPAIMDGSTASELQDGWTEASRRPSSGAARSLRRIAAPVVPYGASRFLTPGSSNFSRDTRSCSSTSSVRTPGSGGSTLDPVRVSVPEWNKPATSSPRCHLFCNQWTHSSDPQSHHRLHPDTLADPYILDPEARQNCSYSPFQQSSPDFPDHRANNFVASVRADPRPSIHGGTFITAQNVNNDYRHGEIGINILHRGVALEALHDSADSFPQPKCHPETREKMLDNLWEYATGPGPREKILWLYGPAGAGKSAIMWSLCEKLEAAGRLGGTFFFKRGHPTRGNAKALFSTIAYRLALRVPWLKGPISQAVENDPSLVGSAPNIQFQKLILGPCQSADNQDPPIIIIDGLDECEGHQMQQEILSILVDCFPQHHRSLRILIASRPEAHISKITGAAYYHALNVEQSFKDVQKYLFDEFTRIHHAHPRTMLHIPSPWPSEEEVRTLVRRSSGYFIYAATIVKFVDDPNFRPTERLAAIIGNRTDPEFDSPFDSLDQLYTQILNTAPRKIQLVNILRVITYFPGHFSPCKIDQLLELDAGNTALALRALYSLIRGPSNRNMLDDDLNSSRCKISWHHASFGDFLRDPTRAGNFHVGGVEAQTDLARSILKAISSVACCEHVGWDINWAWINYVVSSITPSTELLPLIRQINPVFLLSYDSDISELKKIIRWFQEIKPPPTDLIQLWEDYIFLDHFYISLMPMTLESYSPPDSSAFQIEECEEALSKSPGLLCIFHAIDILSSPSIFLVKSLLDRSWDEMREIICPIRDIVGEDLTKLQLLSTWMKDRAKDCQWAMEHKNMARRCIRVLKDVDSGELNVHFWSWTCPSWGLLIRTTPPCPELLQEICEFVPPFWMCDDTDRPGLDPMDFHNVVQWFKTFQVPPLAVIHRWEGYFMKVYHCLKASRHYEGSPHGLSPLYLELKRQIEEQNQEYSFNDYSHCVAHLTWLYQEEEAQHVGEVWRNRAQIRS
ncbi:hypothetical protein FB451DRAFT_1101663 [Mycena latifolia]|nr:hypothetical protein FB451DRAFT_1101663 [Mycena latifolia]